MDQITQATFSVSGQRCTAISRVIVNREIYATVLEGLVKRARELVPMDGLSEGSKLGPLSSQKQLENVESFVRRAVTAGAQVVAGVQDSQRIQMVGFFHQQFLQRSLGIWKLHAKKFLVRYWLL